MRVRSLLTVFALTLSVLVPAAVAAAPSDVTWPAGPGTVHNETAPHSSDVARYIVRHAAAPLAAYVGDLDGLAATSPAVTGDRHLVTDSAAANAYRDFLRTQQDELLAAIELLVARDLEVDFRYDAALNGFTVEVTPAEARAISQLRGVAQIERDVQRRLLTDNGPAWIGAPDVWDTGGDSPNLGEGVVVGIIDTGINTSHPSFADVGPVDGYDHTNPRATYYGLCDPVTGTPSCNDKLIGVYDFTGGTGEDDNGHGSHTASTVAGNVVDASLQAPTTSLDRTISGVAPHANIISYRACGTEPVPLLGGCFPILAPLVAAIDQATIDQVDVINYSIGGTSSNPYQDADAVAFLNAQTAGIVVVTSAGNDGPGAATVGSPGDAPWVTTVAASTHDRRLTNRVEGFTGGDGTPPAPIAGKSVTDALPLTDIVHAGGYGDPLCPPGGFPAGTFSGQIVVCDRGEHARVDKAQAVADGGAGGFVLANDEANGDSLVADAFAIPGVHISYEDGVILKTWLASGTGHQASISGTEMDVAAANGDVTAGFSSRGPNPALASIVKPDVTAPGVDVLAAYADDGAGGADFGIISGTSMSSPHTAGAAALVVAANADLTPDQVRSALMTTAFHTPDAGKEVHAPLDSDGVTDADPFDVGAGSIRVDRAVRAGLVQDETRANYTASDPTLGGDPRTLNIPSFGDAECDTGCSWTRTLTSTLDTEVTWTPSVTGDVPLTVEPASVVVPAGGSAEVTVTADTSDLEGGWVFGRLTLTPDASGVPDASFPVAVNAGPLGQEFTGTLLDLHMHGNVHDGCTGDGMIDITACDGPFLVADPVLDNAPAARWRPPVVGLSGANPRTIYDPSWVWNLSEPTTLGGPMTLRFWASCPACVDGVSGADWVVRLFADAAMPAVVEQQVTATPALPNVPSLLEVTVDVPPGTSASSTFILHIDPVYIDSQQNSIVYYDSTLPCAPESAPTPCDSVVTMPVTTGGGVGNRPPVANDDVAEVAAGAATDIDVLANDVDGDGDTIALVGFSQPVNGTVSDPEGDGVLTYTHDGAAAVSDSFTYTVTDGELEDTATVTVDVQGAQLSLHNSFVSSVGWVKPGETYPFRVLVGNDTAAPATGAEVRVDAPPSAMFTQVAPDTGTATIENGGTRIVWTVGDVPVGAQPTLVAEGRAATFGEDPEVAWKDLSTLASLIYDQLPGDEVSSASHGPKVIPPTGGYETARYGDRPFPVVPVEYVDRPHEERHTADLLEAKINSASIPGSTYNLFQEISLGMLHPQGEVPASGVASATYSEVEWSSDRYAEGGWQFSTPTPQGTCTGATLGAAAGTPLLDGRISNGWYQLPGTTEYYGADQASFVGIAGPLAGLPVPRIGSIDNGCGPTGKAVYDAAHIADPEIDYNRFDTDKDGVVDFFMMVFAGCGGNGASQTAPLSCEGELTPYDNIWPHSSSLEFYYTDAETGLAGYVSDDQLTDLSGVAQCWIDDSYTASDACAADGGAGDDALPVYVRVGPYNVNPEDAIDNASVISHEYGHSLGLPDFYSTGGRSTYGDWNLMATDKSQHMDVFAKQEMGWVVPQALQPGDDGTVSDWRDSKVDTGEIHWVTPDGTPYVLSEANGDQNIHNAQTYVAKLPGRVLIDEAVFTAEGSDASADHAWWSGSGNDFGCPTTGGHNLDIYLPELADLPEGSEVTLEFGSMWDIEWDWDYGFVLVSTDDGESYTSLASNNGYTTPGANNPNNNACQAKYGNGITGTSRSYDEGTSDLDRLALAPVYPEPTRFITDSYDLSSFVGSETVLRFTYATDPAVARPGWFIDNLRVLVDGEPLYTSDFESGPDEDRLFNGGCSGGAAVAAVCTPGWTHVSSSSGSPADHAYYLEMRDRSGFDADGKGENDRAPIAFDPGLLLVYTDEAHGYGNTGADNQPAQTPVDAVPVEGATAPDLSDAAFKAGQTYSDAGAGYLDNYDDGSGSWRHAFDCLDFSVDRLEGTGIGLPFDLVGDVRLTLGTGCSPFTYGLDVIENHAPVAVAQARPTEATVDQVVVLDGSSSYDDLTAPGALSFAWDVDGDGTDDLTGSSASTTFATAGTYPVRLSVTDEGGLVGQDTVTITVTGGGGTDGSTTDGSTTDGSTTGGDTSGGDTSGGDTSGGDTSGGETSGGETSGGETSGGETTSGDTSGGDTSGGVTDPTYRVSGATATQTAIALARELYRSADGRSPQATDLPLAGGVVLARVDLFADGLAGTAFAHARNAPVLVTPSSALAPEVADEIDRLLGGTGKVWLLGGEAALSADVEHALAAAGYEVERLAGTDRYGTAARIAEATTATPRVVYVTTGLKFPDALAAGAVAARTGGVVLLSRGDRRADVTDTYLGAHGDAMVVAIGGAAARAHPEAAAIVGATRFETAVEVADRFFSGATVAGISRSDRFVDALAAGPYLARLGAPLLLTPTGSLHDATAAHLRQARSIERAAIFGGSAAVTEEVRDRIRSILLDR